MQQNRANQLIEYLITDNKNVNALREIVKQSKQNNLSYDCERQWSKNDLELVMQEDTTKKITVIRMFLTFPKKVVRSIVITEYVLFPENF